MQRNKDFNFIGIDPGNNGVKYAYLSSGQIKYGFIPNVTGPAIPLDYPPIGKDEDILSVEILSAEDPAQTKPTFCGELARTQLQEHADQDRDRNKAETDAVNIICPAVFGLLDNDQPIVVGVGATLQDYATQAPLLQAKLTKQHTVEFHYGSLAGHIVSPEVIRTYTYGQAAAGLVGMIKNDAGDIIRADWENEVVLGLDFGHGQINWAVMDHLQIIRAACYSVDYGFYRVGTAVQSFLNAAPYYITATIPQLREAIEQGYYFKNGSKIDLSSVTGEACAQIMDMTYREMKNRISSVLWDRISRIVCMGGAAEPMAPFVGSRLGMKPEIAENSTFTNARALLFIAIEKWGVENEL